jgi:aquaporin related protein
MAGVAGANVVLKPKTLFSSLAGGSESYSKRWRQHYESTRDQGIEGLSYLKNLSVTYHEPIRKFKVGNPLQILIVCWRELLVEFFGTMMLVFMVCGGVVVNNIVDDGPTAGKILSIAFMYGFTVAVMVYATANTSGGHLNPAVTFAVLIMSDISIFKAIMFMICQIAGAIGGAGILYGLVDSAIGAPVHYGATKIAQNVSTNYGIAYTETVGQGFGIELVITFIFVWAVLSTARENRKDYHNFGIAAPLAIGLAVVICQIMAGPLTGCSLNPARSLGPAVVSGYWLYHYIYWLGPLAGALLAAIFYRLLLSLPNVSWAIPRINPDGRARRNPEGHSNEENAEQNRARVEPTA